MGAEGVRGLGGLEVAIELMFSDPVDFGQIRIQGRYDRHPLSMLF